MPFSALAISKRHKQNWTLKDVSFQADAGEILGIFGPSEAGKSTLIRILGGLERDHSGRVELNGAPVVSASHAFYFSSSISDKRGWRNLLFGNAAGSPRKALRTATEQAMGSDTSVLLFDGPMCGVAPGLVIEEFDRLRDAVRSRQKYLIVASANFAEIFELCDRAVVLIDGEAVQTGTPEQIYTDPVSSAVAKLTGRINVFEARRLSSSKVEVPEFQTIQGGHRLLIGKTDRSRLGPLNQNSILAIRPEHISISFGASFPEDNLLRAVIVGVRFLGPSTRVELDAGGLRIEALVMRLVGLKPGDECMLGMPPDRISIFTR